MSDPERGDEEALLKDKVRVRFERISNVISTFFVTLKWTCLVLVLLLRVVGLFMFSIWALDCFVREYKTTALCEEFSLFPKPKIFTSARLFLSASTSFFLILYIRRLNHFPGFHMVLKHLVWQKYFWEIVVVLFAVCAYDIVIILQKKEEFKSLLYSFYIFEKSLGVALVLFLNFLPSDASGMPPKKSGLKFKLYIAALIVYAIEGYTMFILGSTIAAHNVLSVPHTAEISKGGADMTAVATLMLLITNNALRYYLAAFFFSKCLDQDVDILGGGTNSIAESLQRSTTSYGGPASKEASCQVTTPL